MIRLLSFTLASLVFLSPPSASGLTISPIGQSKNETINGMPKVVGELSVTIDGDLNKEEINVTLLDGKELVFLGKIVTEDSWYGELLEEHGRGTANFILKDVILTGSITLEDKVCHISTKVNGTVTVECIQQSDFDIELDSPEIPTNTRHLVARDNVVHSADETEYIDVMIVYTLNAMCAEAGLPYPCEITPENKAPIEARTQLAIQETNAAYNMSNITKGTMRLVHAYLNENYTDVGEEDDFEASSNYQQMLNDVTYQDDGKLEEVESFRKQYGADIVDLWVDVGGACGLAWGACTGDICDGDYAYSVQQRSCTTGYWTFGHENGHVQGCQHDRSNDPDIRLYAYGWQDPSERFRTIMAYDCDNRTCGKVQRFSTPDVTYYGEDIGDENNDNARQIERTWETVATFMPVPNDEPQGNSTGTTSAAFVTPNWIRLVIAGVLFLCVSCLI